MLLVSHYTSFALKISWKSKSANKETTQTKKPFHKFSQMELDVKQGKCSNNIWTLSQSSRTPASTWSNPSGSEARLVPPSTLDPHLLRSQLDASEATWGLWIPSMVEDLVILPCCSCIPSVWQFVAFNFFDPRNSSEADGCNQSPRVSLGGKLNKTRSEDRGFCDSLGSTPGLEWGGWLLPTCSSVSNKCQLLFPHMVGVMATEENMTNSMWSECIHGSQTHACSECSCWVRLSFFLCPSFSNRMFSNSLHFSWDIFPNQMSYSC